MPRGDRILRHRNKVCDDGDDDDDDDDDDETDCFAEGAEGIGHFDENLSLLKRGYVQNLSCENEFHLHENK